MHVFFLILRRPPISTRTDTLFPYTTLFRQAALTLTVVRSIGEEMDKALSNLGLERINPFMGRFAEAMAFGAQPEQCGKTRLAAVPPMRPDLRKNGAHRLYTIDATTLSSVERARLDGLRRQLSRGD